MKKRILKYKVFRGSGQMPWDKLFDEVVQFADQVGTEKVINVSHTSDQGSGTVVVWYWEE